MRQLICMFKVTEKNNSKKCLFLFFKKYSMATDQRQNGLIKCKNNI
jgi:hypothetical protein